MKVEHYNYQVDWGDGYENAYPDFYGMRRTFNAWFAALKRDGALRARVLFGGQEVEERVFE